MSARLHARPLVLVNKWTSIVVNSLTAFSCSFVRKFNGGLLRLAALCQYLADGLPWRDWRRWKPFIVVRHGWNASYFAISSSVSYTGDVKYGTGESRTSRQ